MTETAYTQPAPSSTQGSESLSPVPADELGFALSIFVAAANRTLAASHSQQPELPEAQQTDCERLYADLLVHSPAAVASRLLPYQASLRTAFAALWREYSAHELRDSICARVMCFYFLMERTQGKVVQRWITQCPERPEEVLLAPAVVEGLALVPLQLRAGLVEASFLTAIRTCSRASYAA